MYVYSVQDDGEDESECELAEELLFNNYSSETNGIDMQSTHNIQYIKHGDNGYGFDFWIRKNQIDDNRWWLLSFVFLTGRTGLEYMFEQQKRNYM